MRSYARYIGKFNFGQLELTDPVVIFGLVVVGGMYFAKPQETFLLTVRIHEPGGSSDNIESGRITLNLGSQRITEDLNKYGEIHFAELPQKFLTQKIELLPQVDGFQRIEEQWHQKIPKSIIIYFTFETVDNLATIYSMSSLVDCNFLSFCHSSQPKSYSILEFKESIQTFNLSMPFISI